MTVDTQDTTISDGGGEVSEVFGGVEPTPAASYDDIIASMGDENFGEEKPDGDGPVSPEDKERDLPTESGDVEDVGTEGGKKEEAGDSEDKGKADKSKPKQLTAKTSDGKEIELPEDAVFTKTVDGEEREVSVADALQAYAFDANYTKKYQELSKEKEEAQAEKAKAQTATKKAQDTLSLVGSALKDTVGAIEAGNVDAFIKKFSSITKVSPTVINSAFRKYYIPTLEKYLNATDEERMAMDAEEKEAFSKEKIDSLEKEKQDRETLGNYQRYATSQTQKSGISPEEWEAAEGRLINEYLDGKNVNFLNISPAEVKEYIDTVIILAQDGKQKVVTSSLMEKAAPGLAEEDSGKYDEIVKTISPFLAEFTEDELVEIIKDTLNTKEGLSEDGQKEETSENTAGDKATEKAAPQESKSQLDPEEDDYNPLSVYDF